MSSAVRFRLPPLQWPAVAATLALGPLGPLPAAPGRARATLPRTLSPALGAEQARRALVNEFALLEVSGTFRAAGRGRGRAAMTKSTRLAPRPPGALLWERKGLRDAAS